MDGFAVELIELGGLFLQIFEGLHLDLVLVLHLSEFFLNLVNLFFDAFFLYGNSLLHFLVFLEFANLQLELLLWFLQFPPLSFNCVELFSLILLLLL